MPDFFKQSDVPAGDRTDIDDTLLRFAAGQDVRDRALFESAFAADCVLDFTQPAQALGATIAPFRGRDAVVSTIFGAIANLVTSHSITNARIEAFSPETARLSALVEAQHVDARDPTRRLLLKNLLDVALKRDDGTWRIGSMTFRTLWHEGEPKVLFDNADS